MIVDPDFPDHWKTRMLVDSLGADEAAPVYILRLWAHCQLRRTSTFENLPQAALKALCRFPGHANKFESSLVASGFVRREGPMLIVVGWEEYNASLIANWSNGGKGGRPRKATNKNPNKTHGFSMANPSITHGEPIGEDKIGLEKRREDNPPTTDIAYPPFIEEIWGLTPPMGRERSSKKKLEVSWKATKPKPPEIKVSDALRAWAASDSWTKENGRFVPGIHVWVKDRKWESLPAPKTSTLEKQTTFDESYESIRD